MKPTEALEMANGVLTMLGEQALNIQLTGTPREQIEVVLKEYARRLRATAPKYNAIEDDRMLPDLVIQRLSEELDKT